MKKLLSLIAGLLLIITCQKAEEKTPPTQPKTPYDWDFYTDSSRLAVVKKQPTYFS